MPHSYGASFSGVGFLGPRRTDSPIIVAANPQPSAIMIRTPSQPSMCTSEGTGNHDKPLRACEEFPKPVHAIEAPVKRQLTTRLAWFRPGASDPADPLDDTAAV